MAKRVSKRNVKVPMPAATPSRKTDTEKMYEHAGDMEYTWLTKGMHTVNAPTPGLARVKYPTHDQTMDQYKSDVRSGLRSATTHHARWQKERQRLGKALHEETKRKK